MHPIITLFCSFTRRWAIDGWLDTLAKVEHDPALTNLAIIVDSEQPYIVKAIQRFAEARGYRSLHLKHNTQWAVAETGIARRRQRIADIHEQAKDLISQCDGDIVLGFEDDTVMDRMPSFYRLYQPLERNICGFVEGVQMGRWGTSMIGAWRADRTQDPRQIETLLPPKPEDDHIFLQRDGYESITGGGWYGYATFKDLFLQAPYFTSPSFPWGPDVNFGFWVRQQGYKCLIDWQTVFGHNDYNQTMYPDDPKANLVKVVYNKREDNGKWERTDHEPSRY